MCPVNRMLVKTDDDQLPSGGHLLDSSTRAAEISRKLIIINPSPHDAYPVNEYLDTFRSSYHWPITCIIVSNETAVYERGRWLVVQIEPVPPFYIITYWQIAGVESIENNRRGKGTKTIAR